MYPGFAIHRYKIGGLYKEIRGFPQSGEKVEEI
jgi:hypothetical protein